MTGSRNKQWILNGRCFVWLVFKRVTIRSMQSTAAAEAATEMTANSISISENHLCALIIILNAFYSLFYVCVDQFILVESVFCWNLLLAHSNRKIIYNNNTAVITKQQQQYIESKLITFQHNFSFVNFTLVGLKYIRSSKGNYSKIHAQTKPTKTESEVKRNESKQQNKKKEKKLQQTPNKHVI